ncbi:MAG: ribulose-phosphate 3-epimerase [bacterium]|nr:ribulose-phosphate 3-epimerase [bacterium]
MSIRILPSVLNVPDNNVKAAIDSVADFVDGIHYDVMDGRFVPPTTFSISDFEVLKLSLFTDVHLMVDDPEDWIEGFASAGADLQTIHYEAKQKSVLGTLERIKNLGCLTGLSIKPKTFVETVPDDLWDYADVALIMSVEPGWGGQSFIEEVLDKVRYLRGKYPHKDISIDGGINAETGKMACHAGCNMLVSGSYIFRSEDYRKAVESLRSCEHDL